MAGETDDPEDAAARLEAALERIARHAGPRPTSLLPTVAGAPEDLSPPHPSEDVAMELTGPTPPVEEIAARLDGLIDRLRAALGSSSGGRPE
jgi:hypothetical protein